jgi:hypothetical protein
MKEFGLFSGICSVQEARSRRSSSWDRSGGNCDWAIIPKEGGKVTLLEEEGTGCLNHFYWTFVEDDLQGCREMQSRRENIFRGLVLRAWWNGEKTPAIETPFGDFFGVSNGHYRNMHSLAFTSNPGSRGIEDHATWGFNCYLPMPFLKGARIEIENQGNHDARIWFHLDYETYSNKESIPANTGYLHAVWNHESPTEIDGEAKGINLDGSANYTILDTQGQGTLAGYFLTVVNRAPQWWGEGDDMVFIDGEVFPPSLHGTGTEEIFGGGACPDTEYSGPYTGFHCIENRDGFRWFGTNGMYRFFLHDPIRFSRSLRVSIEHGHANDLANHYSSVAFWYDRSPSGKPRPFPSLEKRKPLEV